MLSIPRRIGLALLVIACMNLGACAHRRQSRDAGQAYYPAQSYESSGGLYGQPARGERYSRGQSEVQYGQVRSIEQEYRRDERNEGSTEGGGALAGAVIGGVIGNQIGRDDGRDHRRGRHGRGSHHEGSGNRAAATVIGAIGGALIGNAIERQSQRDDRGSRSVFHVLVRMENRREQWFELAQPGDLRVGDRVRIENGQLQRW